MLSDRTNIYLIGYRGTGKTTVGRILATTRGFGFHDMDTEITTGAQKSIARIVASHGWTYFRKLEKACLQRLAAEKNAVIATGGGIVLQPVNIVCMQNNGKIVWLRASSRTIMDRLLQDPTTADSRPALTPQAFEEEIVATLAKRRERYRQAADLSLMTDGLGPDEVAARIQKMLA